MRHIPRNTLLSLLEELSDDFIERGRKYGAPWLKQITHNHAFFSANLEENEHILSWATCVDSAVTEYWLEIIDDIMFVEPRTISGCADLIEQFPLRGLRSRRCAAFPKKP